MPLSCARWLCCTRCSLSCLVVLPPPPPPRLRRAEVARDHSKKSLEGAEQEAVEGPQKVNNKRLEEEQAKKAAAKQGAEEMEDEEDEVEEGDWERATEEGLASALSDAKDRFTHSTSYVIGELDLAWVLTYHTDGAGLLGGAGGRGGFVL